MFRSVIVTALGLFAVCAEARAQDGAALFRTYCATCHESASTGAPSIHVLRQMRPEQILQALDTGAMRRQATERSRAQRRVLAEYLSGKPQIGRAHV